MALASKKNRPAAAKKDTKKVEETAKAEETVEKEVNTTEQQTEQQTAAEKKAPEEQPAPTKSVATRPSTAVGFAGKVQLALKEYQDALPPIDFGTLPRIKASQGALICDDEVLGKQAEVSIVSFNNSFAITPNENNADSSYCKFSYDNNELNDGSGTSVQDHLAYLRSEGFANAASKRYVEVVCMLDDADEDHDEIGNMVQLSLSPQSVKQFERYQLQTTIKLGKNEVTPEQASRVVLTAKTKTFGKNTFTLVTFSLATD